MHTKIIILLSLLLSNLGWSQINVPEKKNCYEKSLARKGQRFADIECGKVFGVIDCNDKLEIDEPTGMVLVKSTGRPYSGACETCHMNGIMEHRITFVNGLEEGTDTTTYESGCTMVVRSHVQGKENGKWIYYYDSTGREAWEMNYLMGEKHGIQLFYGPKGDTTLVENYKNGLLHGTKKTYFKKLGTIEKEVNYQNGLLHGPYIVYSKEGKVLQKLNYKNGKKEGVWTYYYDDGTLLRTENWSDDQKNGQFKTLFYQGTIQTIENYKKGVREGWFEERYPDQKMKRQALYKKDVLVEEHVFDEQGKETYTFGAQPKTGNEDDEMPTKGKKGKKKKK